MSQSTILNALLKHQEDIEDLKTELYGAWLPETREYDTLGLIQQVGDQQLTIKQLKKTIKQLEADVEDLKKTMNMLLAR